MFEAIKETLYLEKSLLVQNELKLSSSNERNYRISTDYPSNVTMGGGLVVLPVHASGSPPVGLGPAV